MPNLPILVSVIIPTYKRLDILGRCIESVLASTDENIEIIIIDNNEDTLTREFIEKNYKNISIQGNGENMGASWARSFGAKQAKGEWVLFVDDDNVIDKKMIEYLVTDILKDDKIGAISPVMYYLEAPKKIWFCGANFNFYTSKPLFFKDIVSSSFYECSAIHNVYMIKKSIGDTVGWLDESLFMGYEEFDLLCKIKNAGYKIGISPLAKDLHDHPVNDSILRLVNTPKKAFSTIRNRVIIMKRYASLQQFIIFIVFFYPVFIVSYTYFMMREKRFDLLNAHLKGAIDGYRRIFKA